MKKIISILFTLVFSFAAFAQSADVITDILDTEEATYGQVCYLLAAQQKLILDDATYVYAVEALYENGQIPELYGEDDSITAIDAAFLFSRMWDIKGGLMYRLTKGSPRYVFRQFQADGVIGSSVQPKDSISGSDILSMYTSCLRKYGDFDITEISMGDE